jgi:threonine dehydrogenase-like Zn-dependent dehydrogenase
LSGPSVVVEAMAEGVCGTDVEIAAGLYGWPTPSREWLILGHESLGRVLDPGPSGFAVGDHVVGIVRRPDPKPCANCAVGEWDCPVFARIRSDLLGGLACVEPQCRLGGRDSLAPLLRQLLHEDLDRRGEWDGGKSPEHSE